MNYLKKIDLKNSINSITDGGVGSQILLFFFPILLGTFFQQLYNTFDAIIVGRFIGKEALASVGGSTGTLINLFVGFFVGLASGFSVTISHFFGAKRDLEVETCVHTAIGFSILVGIILMVLGYIGTPWALHLMLVPDDILENSTVYLRIYFMGMIGNLIYNIGAAILRAVGDSKRPLYFLVVSCFTNIILDIVFVTKLDMGVAGAATATVISQFVSAILVLYVLSKSQASYKLIFNKIHINFEYLKKMTIVGFPAGMQATMYNLSNIIIQTSINTLGTNTIAAWTALGKIDPLYWMTIQAFGISVTTFTGQNYGAKRPDRIKRGIHMSLLMSAVTTIALSITLFVSGPLVYHLFTTDQDVINIGVHILRIMVPTYITYIYIEIYSSSLRGVGDTWIPMILTFLGVCVLRVVWIAIAVPLHPYITTIAVSYPLTWATTSILFIIYFHQFSRLKDNKKASPEITPIMPI